MFRGSTEKSKTQAMGSESARGRGMPATKLLSVLILQ